MILQISDIQLFNALKNKLGDKEAEQLVTFVKSYVKEEISEQVPGIATKDFVNARISEVEVKIAETKFQLILWAFVFWATQLGAIFAFIRFIK
jgi:hypothetical protein